jgi:hypothetical protein
MKKFIKEYSAEIIVATLAIVGIVLLAGNFSFQAGAKSGFSLITRYLFRLADKYFWKLVIYLMHFTILDLIGWILIVGATLFIVIRIRNRFLYNPANAATICPKCGSQIKRKHRSWFDRTLSKTLLPGARRYTCSNTTCRWTGLRHQRSRPDSVDS